MVGRDDEGVVLSAWDGGRGGGLYGGGIGIIRREGGGS